MKKIIFILLMNIFFFNGYATAYYEITTPGNNVGIGSINPGQALDVQGTIRSTGFDTSVNTSTYNIGGYPVIIQGTAYFSYPVQQSLAVGWGALNNLDLTTYQFDTGVGTMAGAKLTTGTENTLVGTISGSQLTTGAFNTAQGENSLGQEITTSSNTAIGNDTMRNTVGANSDVAIGTKALRNGAGFKDVAIGYQSDFANASSVIVTGTGTSGDVITLTFTGTFTGSPTQVQYTVPSNGYTPTQIATGLAAAISASYGGTGPVPVAGSGSSGVSNGNYVGLNYAGTSTTGPAAVVTTNVSGAATEILTVMAGYTGNLDIAIGYNAMLNYGAGATASDIAIGGQSMPNLTSGSDNTCIGLNCGLSISSGTNNQCFGTNSCENITTPSYNFCGGYTTCNSLTTGGRNIELGAQVGTTTLSTGNDNILLGATSSVDTPATNTNNFLNIGNTITANMNGASAISASNTAKSGIGMGTTLPLNTLDINGNEVIGASYAGIKTAPINGLIVQGNVGIGSTVPGQALDIQGTVRTIGVNITSLSPNSLTCSDSNGNITTTGCPGGTVYAGGNPPQLQFNNGGNLAGIVNTGSDGTNIGIGTVTAVSGLVLDVEGTLGINGVNGINYPSWDTTSNGSIAIGSQSQNVGIGTYAPYGAGNTSVGYQTMNGAMTNATIGNTAMGFQALSSNTTGTLNSGFGYRALKITTSGSDNSAFGDGAGVAITSGNSNDAFGHNALSTLSTNSNNSAFGSASLTKNTANNNSAFGASSLQQITTGANNIALGYQAGNFISGGVTNNTTSNNSVYLGYQAYPLANGDTDEIVIGQGAVGIGSYTTTFGNSSTIATVIQYGNVGIGSSNPGQMLDVQGTIRGFQQMEVAGNVSIGTTVAPSALMFIPSLKATTGQRYLCIDTSGNVTSVATACTGT